MNKLLLIPILLLCCSCIDFNMPIQGRQRFCFYEVFDTNQKYSFLVRPHTGNKMQVEVSMIEGRQWKQVFYQNTQTSGRYLVKVHKLASAATTYSFCVKNLDSELGMFNITSNSGIEVMELHELPNLDDAANLERELNWLSSQNDALKERADNLVGLRNTNEEIAMMVGTKMIIFAVVGMLVILGVNLVFYRSIKKTLKDRKLI